MSLQSRLTLLAQAIGADVKSLLAAQGSLAALTTTSKTSLVAAINELVTTVDAMSGGSEILDTAGDGDSAHTWSANKIYDELAALRSSLLNGVEPAYDTLLEIASKLGSDDTAIAGLLTAVGNRVQYDAAQALTTPQKAQACANIGVGDPETDLAALYVTAKA